MKEDPRTMDILNPELRGMPQHDYHEELNIRSHKAGYTARDGGPIPPKIRSMGATDAYRNGWERVFGKAKTTDKARSKGAANVC